MTNPVDVATISLAGGAVSAVGLLGLGIALDVKDFADRVVWDDDATAVGKVRVLVLHVYHSFDWPTVGRTLAKLVPIGTAATAALVIFAIGLLEVIGA